MKKFIAMLLAAILIVGLCACGGGGQGDKTSFDGLHVGYGKVSITPETGVPLGGYGDTENRISTEVVDNIYTTCIAMSEGEETVLLFTNDAIRSLDVWTQAVRERITSELGIPADHIMLCATHSHSTPELNSSDPRISAYMGLFVDACLNAAKAALEDRAPATIHGVKSEQPGMTFVRHYKLSNGTYAGSNFGDFDSGIILDYATEADDEMILVKFDRADDKKDVLLVNWQAHPDMSKEIGFYSISPSFIGPLRDKLEELSGMQVAYFTGDTGNQNGDSKIAADAHRLHFKEYGQELAQRAYDSLSNLTPIEGSGIKSAQENMEYPMNHENEDKIDRAREVVVLYSSDPKAANALAAEYGLGTYREASSAIARVNRPATGILELNAFYIGGMAFITAPYEMFSDNGIFIKESSPFTFTMLCTNANDWNSYCAADYSYDYISYESSAGHFARGCAEASADKLVELLKSLQ